MKLSINFSLEELTFSEIAKRRGLNNNPPPDALLNLSRLAIFLEDVRRVVGKPIMVNSGYRSPEVNSAAGGKPTSQHCKGLAADIRVAGMTPDEVVKSILDAGLLYDQVIREFDSWTHVSIPEKNKDARKQALIIDTVGTRNYA